MPLGRNCVINVCAMEQQKPKYCLYARKSSESDERQAMSIDSQIKEMTNLALKEGIDIVEIKQESHSAKQSSTRPLFLDMLSELREAKYNGILTWAPDRLSRNAGDLGSLVDLMDMGKLQHIRTYGQTFTNSPSEKFLLMILCSQAKLENDNRGVNVKRGIRAKCEMGWRPCPAPLGYYNRSYGGIKDIIPDPEIAPTIIEIFERVAYRRQSGRDIREWLECIDFKTKTGKNMSLSMIYRTLRNPFYYGVFRYPENSDNWYNGSHKPLITKELFDIVQDKLRVPRKLKWGSKGFAFSGTIKCAGCQGNITGEEKFKKLISGEYKRHVYYHCNRAKDYTCKEPFITEIDLYKELYNFINTHNSFKLSEKLRANIELFQKIANTLNREVVTNVPFQANLRIYAKHVIYEGTLRERKDFITGLNEDLYLHNKQICSKPV